MADDKFSSGRYTYPLNIEADEYGGNFVMYQIGVSGRSASSTLSLADGAQMTAVSNSSSAIAKNTNLSIFENKDYLRVLPYAAAAGFGGISGVDSQLGMTAAVNIGNKVTNLVGDVSTTNYTTIKESICLYMPDVSMRYSASWEDKTLAVQAIMGKIAENLLDTDLTKLAEAYIAGGFGGSVVQKFLNLGDKSAGSAVGVLAYLNDNPTVTDRIFNNKEDILKNLALTLEPTQIIQKQAGIARNPLSELLFTNIDRRTFTHKFSFFPRSKAEADSVREIIRLFKYHMHPEYIKGGFNLNYIYPSEFYISYYTDNKPSNTLPKHAACALTSLDVDYSKGDQFSTLKDGTPTEITMTLGFSELALLTKESFGEEGGNLS